MRALVKPTEGPGFELRDVPEPTAGHGEVKIRVMRAGLCGTDLHIQSWDDFAAEHVKPGQTISHEFYGEIVEIGPLKADRCSSIISESSDHASNRYRTKQTPPVSSIGLIPTDW